VIPTSARIGSLGPGRFPYSHCGWTSLRSSDSDFCQNWRPGTGEIPLLSLWLGIIEVQWFRLLPELAAWDRGDSPTLTVAGRHWGPVIQTSARIGSPGPGRFPYSHCGWASLRSSDSDFGQNWKPGTGEIPLLISNDPKVSFRCMNHTQSTYHSAFDKPVELHWWRCGKWLCMTRTRTQDPLFLGRMS
jgi:hypothetical protein